MQATDINVVANKTVPLAVTVPAVAAAASYINAKGLVSHDLQLLSAIIPTVLKASWSGLRGRTNLFYQLESLATSKKSENRLFLKFEDRTYTYAQTYDTVLRYASWLKERRGIKKGELVALDFQNTDTFIFLFLALWALGATPALINYNLSGRALVHCVKRANARLVLVDPEVASNVGDDVRSELSEVTFEVVTPELERQMLKEDSVRPPDEVRSDANAQGMAMLIFTSGTTGLPKAAIVSWAKTGTVAGFTSRWIGTKTTDVYYTVSQLDRTKRQHPD